MAKEKSKKDAEAGFGEKILDIIQRNRKKLLISFILLIVVLTASIVIVTVRGNFHEAALVQIDEFERRFFLLHSVDEFNLDQELAFLRISEIHLLLEELDDFQNSFTTFSYASARAYSLTADIHWFLHNFAEAEAAWLNAASASRGSYLEAVSLFNAAVAAEEHGNITAAIAHYNRVLELREFFPSPARAQFAIGRLEETRGSTDAALNAYNDVLRSWPNDPLWANLAQSRIAALSN